MSDTTNTDRRTDDDRPAMRDVSHTNPHTGESFGESQVFQRGRVVVVDGGEADAGPEDDETMADVDHTPREGAPDPNRVHERGGEHEADAADPEAAEE